MTPVDSVATSNVFHTVLGAYNSGGLRAYRRADLRASHNIDTSLGGLSFFVELFNVFGIRNTSAWMATHSTSTRTASSTSAQ
jgi:hypothetical protein